MTPIIKWAGGKRQLLPALLEGLPNFSGRYVEPFLGSGALFFELQPQKAIINDINLELINMYVQIRDNCDAVKLVLDDFQIQYNRLKTSDERSQLYYEKRSEFNQRIGMNQNRTEADAALFIFLNKACYNGLYRVNAKGQFNTPTAKRVNLNLYDEENMNQCSTALLRARILNCDFAEACKGLRKGDFVYFDSPYYDTYDSYQPGGFPTVEHERLATLFKRLSKRGIYCMLSNSDTKFIKDLYSDFSISIIPVKRLINCDGTKRMGTEVIIRNY